MPSDSESGISEAQPHWQERSVRRCPRTAIAALTLSACGSDNNAGTPSPTSGRASGTGLPRAADCGGKNSLTGEGSTAQQNAIAEFNKVWGQVCSGKNLSYNPTGSGCGPRAVHRQAGRLRRLRLARSKDDQIDRPPQTLRRQPGVEPAAGVRPRRHGLQPRGRRQAGRQRRRARQDLPGPDQQVERPGHRRAEQRCDAARHRHQADLPLGLVGHHRQLPEVPGRRGARSAWTKGAGKEFQGGAGEGAQKSAGVVQAVQATPGAIGYVEKGFADQAGVPYAQIDSGAGAVELTDETAEEGHRRRQVRRRGQRPDAGPGLDVRHQGGRRLPAGAGHLRDRLLEGLRRRHRRCGQVVPDRGRQRGPGRTCRPRATCRLPDAFKERLLDVRSTQSRSYLACAHHNSGEDGCGEPMTDRLDVTEAIRAARSDPMRARVRRSPHPSRNRRPSPPIPRRARRSGWATGSSAVSRRVPAS